MPFMPPQLWQEVRSTGESSRQSKVDQQPIRTFIFERLRVLFSFQCKQKLHNFGFSHLEISFSAPSNARQTEILHEIHKIPSWHQGVDLREELRVPKNIRSSIQVRYFPIIFQSSVFGKKDGFHYMTDTDWILRLVKVAWLGDRVP